MFKYYAPTFFVPLKPSTYTQLDLPSVTRELLDAEFVDAFE